MNDTSRIRNLIRPWLAASFFLLGMAVLLAACAVAGDPHAWPERTVRSAAQAFVEGYNQRDLAAFDDFFASPAQGADPAGLSYTKDAAHELVASAQPGTTVQLSSLAITSQRPANPKALATIHYRARLSLRDGQHDFSTQAVEQTVQLERIRNRWLIIGGDQAQVTSAPAQATAPLPEITVPSDSAPATGAAIETLANALGVAPTQVKLASSEALTWPDHCLGVTQLGVRCQPGETPGFRIILESGRQRYEYHTDAYGILVRPSKGGPVIASAAAVSAARDTLAGMLGISADQVHQVSNALTEWPDSCLGIAMPGASCDPGITPGYLITLEAQGHQFEYHTNADASVVVPVAVP